jgi:hypothetical protein
MPTFCAITPERMFRFLLSIGGPAGPARRRWVPKTVQSLISTSTPAAKSSFHQRIDRLRRRVDDVEQPLVRAHLELLAAPSCRCAASG